MRTLALLQYSLQATCLDHLLHVQETQSLPQDPPTQSAPEIEGQISSVHSTQSGLQGSGSKHAAVKGGNTLNTKYRCKHSTFTRVNSFIYHRQWTVITKSTYSHSRDYLKSFIKLNINTFSNLIMTASRYCCCGWGCCITPLSLQEYFTGYRLRPGRHLTSMLLSSDDKTNPRQTVWWLVCRTAQSETRWKHSSRAFT